MSDDMIERARWIQQYHATTTEHDLAEALLAEHERAEQAERKRDEWRIEAMHWSSRPQEEAARARAAEARVATLEAVLDRIAHYPITQSSDAVTLRQIARDALDAALGEQEAEQEQTDG